MTTEPSQQDPVLIRAAVPGDLNFIWRTWLSGLREAPNGLPDEFWYPAHRGYIERELSDEKNAVLVACASDAPTEILGWVVARPRERLEWVHVRKGSIRGRGLAGRLLRAAGMTEGVPVRWRPASGKLRVSWQPRRLRAVSSTAAR